MPKQIKDKITNKITISVPSDFDEVQYETIKHHHYITGNFKKSHKFNYGIREYIALYPIKIYDNEDEFFEVCEAIQKISLNDVKFTYKYKSNTMEYLFKFPKIKMKKHVEFIEDSD